MIYEITPQRVFKQSRKWENKLEDFMRLFYSTRVTPNRTTDGSLCYLASHPELPGCMSHGDTPERAIENLSEARKLYIRTLLRKGESVPLPRSSTMVIWEIVGVELATSSEKPSLGISEINPIEYLEQSREEITTT